MVYRLRVIPEAQWDDNNAALKDFVFRPTLWENYCDAQLAGVKSMGLDIHGGAVYDNLRKFNAVDIPGQPFVDFDTEEDATAFILKFG